LQNGPVGNVRSDDGSDAGHAHRAIIAESGSNCDNGTALSLFDDPTECPLSAEFSGSYTLTRQTLTIT